MADDPTPDAGNDKLIEALTKALDHAKQSGGTPLDAISRAIGDAMGNALREDNATLRAKNREIQKEIETLKAKLAPDGAVILTGDDAKAWMALQGMNVKPAELPAALKKSAETEAALALRERKDAVTKAAEVAAMNPDVLWHLAEKDGIAVGLDAEGNPVATKDGKATPLDEFAEATWAPFLPALTTTETPEKPTEKVSEKVTERPAPVTRSGTKPPTKGFDVDRIAAEQRATGAYSRA